MTRQHIRVSLHDNGTSILTDGLLGSMQPIQRPALMKNWRFWGIEIFGCMQRRCSLQRTPPKSHRAPKSVVNREHQPVAKAIVDTLLAFSRQNQATPD